jgi:hypothetical protein
MINVDESKLADITLEYGSHRNRKAGMCAMEAVAFLANEPHSDAPECACPVVASLIRRFNDRLPDDETRTRLLKPLLVKLVGSRSTPEVERKRAYLAADWAVRECTPLALESAKLPDEAAKLRALPPLVDAESARVGKKAARAAQKVAWGKYAYADAAAADAYAADAYAAAAYAAAAYADAAAADAYAADAAAAAADAYAAYADAAAAYAAAYAAAAAAAYAAAYAAAAAAADAYAADAYAAAREPVYQATVRCIERMLDIKE